MLDENMLRGSLTSTEEGRGALGFKGERGYSAYEIAVQNGYIGTEQEWIDHFGLDLTGYLKTTDIVDNVTTNNSSKPLSAAQGRYLKNYVDTYTTNEIGDTTDLDTTSKVVVNAINEVNSNVGDKSSLSTTTKTDLVSSINEVYGLCNRELELYKGKNLVIFGDSWSQPGIANSEDEYWCKQVSSALGMTRFNYAIAGAGFSRTGNKLSSQLTTASSGMTTAQKNNTALVIVFAGYNDIVNSMDDATIISDASSLLSSIHTTYPNAKIVLAPFNWEYSNLTQSNNAKISMLINRIMRETCTLPIIILKLVRYWIYGMTSFYRNQSHPSVSGYKVIASMFLNAILGGGEHICYSGTITPELGQYYNFAWNMEDGNVTIFYDSSFTSALSSYSGTLGYLPSIAVPGRAIVCPLYQAGSGGQVGSVLINTNGTCYLKNVTVSSGQVYMLPVTFKCSSTISWYS